MRASIHSGIVRAILVGHPPPAYRDVFCSGYCIGVPDGIRPIRCRVHSTSSISLRLAIHPFALPPCYTHDLTESLSLRVLPKLPPSLHHSARGVKHEDRLVAENIRFEHELGVQFCPPPRKYVIRAVTAGGTSASRACLDVFKVGLLQRNVVIIIQHATEFARRIYK